MHVKDEEAAEALIASVEYYVGANSATAVWVKEKLKEGHPAKIVSLALKERLKESKHVLSLPKVTL